MIDSGKILYLLKNWRITASAPCRVDIGGTWDLKALALPYESIKPSTVNLALDMRTDITLNPYDAGYVRVTDGDTVETCKDLDNMTFDTQFGILFAIICHFGLHSLELQIRYGSPRRSGLGGSGTLAVTAIGALGKLLELSGQDMTTYRQIVEIAHEIEDGLRFSYTGLQDQCAALYGGINHWVWQYTHTRRFWRKQLLPVHLYGEIVDRMIVAYTGKSHHSDDVNSQQVESFFNLNTRPYWLEINSITHRAAKALNAQDWKTLALCISAEHAIRVSMVPDRSNPISMEMEKAAKQVEAGFAVVGAGNGGCVWAFCPHIDVVADLKDTWNELLKSEDGMLLDSDINDKGLIVEIESR